MIIGYNEKNNESYGKFEKEPTDIILQANEHKLKECGLFYIAYPITGSPIERYRSITILTNPLSIDDNLSYMLACKTAENCNVNLTQYHFGRGEDEDDERNVFCIECFEETEIASSIERLHTASKKLDSRIDKIMNLACA